MSTLLIKTINPFRSDINELPRLRYTLSDDPHRRMYGIIKEGSHPTQGDFFKFQYIPSDSPHGSLVWKPNTTDYEIDQMLYTLNKQGFRGDNFNKEDDAIMFLGCSYTFGTAVADEDVWCRNVARRRNKKCWNLGVPGSGNQQIFMMADSFLESGYKPSEAVILWTEPLRKLLFHDSSFNVMSQQNQNARQELLENDLQQQVDEFSPAWISRLRDEARARGDHHMPFELQESQTSWALMSENHLWFDFYTYRTQTLNLFKAHDIPVTEMHTLPSTAHFCQNIDRIDPWDARPYNLVFQIRGQEDLGRDNMHWGPKSNRKAEELYFRLLKDKQG